MGKTYTPKHRIEFKLNDGMTMGVAFKGRVTERTVASFVANMNHSFKPGNCNGHLSNKILLYVNSAKVIEQKSGNIVASYVAPMFQVI